MISFTIKGRPLPLKRHRSTRTGRMYDPSAKDKKNILLRIAKFKPKQPFAGDIYLKLIFTMPRPKYHYRTGKFKHLLKSDIPCNHSVKPDIDNLVKMISDVLQPHFYVDDSQICRLQAEKVYGKNGKTEIIIEEL